MLAGVIQQIAQDRLQRILADRDFEPRQRLWHDHSEPRRRITLGHAPHHGGQFGTVADRSLQHIGTSQFQQAPHQPFQPGRVLIEIAQKALALGDGHGLGVIAQQFQRAAHRRQRGLELVGYMSGKGADIVGALFQMLGHAAHRLRQLGDFPGDGPNQWLHCTRFPSAGAARLLHQRPQGPQHGQGGQQRHQRHRGQQQQCRQQQVIALAMQHLRQRDRRTPQ